ncbi:MAG: hypothetical protein QW548_01600 [Candidatus Aenigmatarchaeota archaeon]
MHIKTIKGRKYYYESKRIGKRVTSIYIGPVEKVDKKCRGLDEETEPFDEEFYVG